MVSGPGVYGDGEGEIEGFTGEMGWKKERKEKGLDQQKKKRRDSHEWPNPQAISRHGETGKSLFPSRIQWELRREEQQKGISSERRSSNTHQTHTHRYTHKNQCPVKKIFARFTHNYPQHSSSNIRSVTLRRLQEIYISGGATRFVCLMLFSVRFIPFTHKLTRPEREGRRGKGKVRCHAVPCNDHCV